jgi:hypothetical protein
MKNIESLLKVLKKSGYPNSKFEQLCKFVGYDKDNFLIDLVDEYGPLKSLEFVTKGIMSLSQDSSGSFKLDLSSLDFNNSYVNIELYNFSINFDEVRCNYVFGSSVLNHDEIPEIKNIDDLMDDLDMTESWEFIDELERILNEDLEPKLGFKINI